MIPKSIQELCLQEDDVVTLSRKRADESVIIARLQDLYEKTYQTYAQKTQALERAKERAETHPNSFSLIRRLKGLKDTVDVLNDFLRYFEPNGEAQQAYIRWANTGLRD